VSLERDSGWLEWELRLPSPVVTNNTNNNNTNTNNNSSRLGLRVGALHGELERLAGEPGAGLWSAGVGAAPTLTRSRHVPARHAKTLLLLPFFS
jgi:hypothetical protein